MDYVFSSRVQKLKPSVIREILKMSGDPSVIPFSAGNPAPEAFPAKELAEISANLFATRPIDVLQYSISEGYQPLRERVAEDMRRRHRSMGENDEVLITSGAQQVMELTAKALCNEGDTVICESPSFIGSLNAFRSFGLNLRGVELEEDGISIDGLETALKEEKRAKFLYLIPNFQNPSGITMSEEKRRVVYALARRYGVVILEDNPYGELRFEGDAIPTIKSMDTDGIVVYAGTFSKVLSPGLRVGYAIAPKGIMPKLVVCKQVSDVHTGIWAQMIAEQFMANYDLEGHIQRIQHIYRKKAALMVELMEKELPASITFRKPQGGLFLWATIPEGKDMLAFCAKAVQDYRVAIVPGNAFLTDETKPCHSFRLNYATPTDEQIRKGMALLGKAAVDLL